MNDHQDTTKKLNADRTNNTINTDFKEFAFLYYPFSEFALSNSLERIINDERLVGELSEILEIIRFLLDLRSYRAFVNFFKDRTLESTKYIYRNARCNLLQDIRELKSILDLSPDLPEYLKSFKKEIEIIFQENIVGEA